MSQGVSSSSKLLGKLRIAPKHARFKKGLETFGKMDPYITLEFNAQKFQTKVAKDQGKFPKWDDSFTFEITEESVKLPQANLIIKASDWDTKKNRHSLDIGMGTVPMQDLIKIKNEEIMKEVIISDKGHGIGTLDFEMEFQTETTRLLLDSALFDKGIVSKNQSLTESQILRQLPPESQRRPKSPDNLSRSNVLTESQVLRQLPPDIQRRPTSPRDLLNTSASWKKGLLSKVAHSDHATPVITEEGENLINFRPSQAQSGHKVFSQQPYSRLRAETPKEHSFSDGFYTQEEKYSPDPRILRKDYQSEYEKSVKKQMGADQDHRAQTASSSFSKDAANRQFANYMAAKTEAQLNDERIKYLTALAKEYDYSRLLKPRVQDENQTKSPFAQNFRKFTLVVRPRGVDLPGMNNEAMHMKLRLLVFLGERVFETRYGSLAHREDETQKNFVTWTDSLSFTVDYPDSMFRIFLVDENKTKQDIDDIIGSFEQGIEAIDELFYRTNNRVASFDLKKKGRVIGTIEVEFERKTNASVGATTHLPAIAIARGQALFKKVVYENSEKASKTLELRISRPELLSVEEPLIVVGPVRKIHIRVCLYSPLMQGEAEVKLDIFCVENNCIEESIIFTLRSIY